MVKINNISLKNFRNFINCQINFNSNCNILFGDNGSGKTNILESISLLSKGRGFRNASILDLVNKEEQNFFISSEIEKDNIKYNVDAYNIVRNGNHKKVASLNNEVSNDTKNFLDHSLSFLLFLPEMERLFLSSPSSRRNFIDKLIFTENKMYNSIVNKYKKKILERSKVLQNPNYDNNWINVLEREISEVGLTIFNLRNEQINLLNQNLMLISNNSNYPFKVELKIKDSFFEDKLDLDKYLDCLVKSRQSDIRFGGCAIGPHKSDITAKIDKSTDASQLSTGQQKTLILMMIIAQCNYLVNIKDIKPIILFDEICSHLDQINRKILLELTNEYEVQFFLTGTEKSLFSFMSTNSMFYNITEL
mgnify:CR=1 FL=1